MPGVPTSGRLMSNVPARPCVFRETTFVGVGGGQTAQRAPAPLSGARSIGLVKVAPFPSAPSPANVSPNGLVTAAVWDGSVIGIVGLPIPLRGTLTVTVPFAPALKVPVVAFNVVILLLLGFHGPQK